MSDESIGADATRIRAGESVRLPSINERREPPQPIAAGRSRRSVGREFSQVNVVFYPLFALAAGHDGSRAAHPQPGPAPAVPSLA